MPDESFVSRQWLIDEYHRRHKGPPGGALNMIEEAPAADVVPRPRWIPAAERLPECGTEVLAAIYGTDLIVQEDGESLEDAVRRARSGPGRVEMGYLDQDGIWTEILFGAPMMVLPRYWMPLPEPPKNDEEENGDVEEE